MRGPPKPVVPLGMRALWIAVAFAIACKAKDESGSASSVPPPSAGARDDRASASSKDELDPACHRFKGSADWSVITSFGSGKDRMLGEYDEAAAAKVCETLCGTGWRLPDEAELSKLYTVYSGRDGITAARIMTDDGGEAVGRPMTFWLRSQPPKVGTMFGDTSTDAVVYKAPVAGAKHMVFCKHG